MNPDDPRHGSVAGYVNRCRCEDCKVAWRVNQRNLRARHYLAKGPLVIDATGTRRRLRALVAIGWSLKDVDSALGRAETFCSHLLRPKGGIRRTTAEEVAAVYERLCMQPREGWVADRQRRFAATRGWPAPLAWDDIDLDPEPVGVDSMDNSVDEIVIHRVLSGDFSVKASKPERDVIVHIWRTSGRNLAELERATGWAAHRYGLQETA